MVNMRDRGDAEIAAMADALHNAIAPLVAAAAGALTAQAKSEVVRRLHDLNNAQWAFLSEIIDRSGIVRESARCRAQKSADETDAEVRNALGVK